MQNLNKMKAALFDLDGVLVDTAKYHFLAWKRLARELGIQFTEQDNELLKGVSRVKSLEILLSLGSLSASVAEKEAYAMKKNKWYVEYLHDLDESALLPGSVDYLEQLKKKKILIGLGSASKNAVFILQKLGIASFFDAIVDGNMVTKAKPDPEVFLKGAKLLEMDSQSCVVFEDSMAGVEAAKKAGMFAVGIGTIETLPNADICIPDLLTLLKKEIALG